MKKILTILAVVILLLPLKASAEAREGGEWRNARKARAQAYREQQKKENKAFRQSLRGPDMGRDQKIAAIKEHRQTQYGENAAFREQQHQEGVNHLNDKLAQNNKLTDTQKQEILNHVETQYRENIAFRDQQHTENISAVDQILGDLNLSPEERRAEMKKYRAVQKEENKQHRQTQKEENQTFRQSLKPQEWSKITFLSDDFNEPFRFNRR